MKKYLERLPRDTQQLISFISRVAESKGMRVYLVGGFVRDLILGVDNFDLDIVVEGDGIALAEELANVLRVRFIRHHRFGTATLTVDKDTKVDISTARKEFYPTPGCLPQVTYSTIREDLQRRDFSINAMSISINRNDFGELVDFFKGQEDLKHKSVRVLHAQSFIDDPTRILRAVRFEQRFGFRIERETLKLLRQAVAEKRLHDIQPQRIRDELILDLKEPRAIKTIRRLNDLVGFSFLYRSLRLNKKAFAILAKVPQQLDWFKANYPQRRPLESWLIYLMALLDPLGAKEAKKVCNNFVFKKGEKKRILSVKGITSTFIRRLSSRELNPSAIFSLLEPLSYEVIIFLKGKYPNRNFRKRIEDFLEIYNGMRIEVSGEDLSGLGLSPGPSYKKIFAKVLKAKLEGRVTTKAEELGLIRALITK